MSTASSIIVINGRRYDAHTGKPLHGGSHSALRPVSSQAATHKPVTARKAAASRHLAKHATRHTPKPSRTLMRKTVKKPAPALKRHIKVQSHLGHVHEHRSEVAPHVLHGHFERKPRHYEAKKDEGRLISHFSPDLFTVVGHVEHQPAAKHKPQPRHQTTSHKPAAPTRTVHKKPLTTAELLDYAVQQAQVPHEAPARKHHRKLLKRSRHPVAV